MKHGPLLRPPFLASLLAAAVMLHFPETAPAGWESSSATAGSRIPTDPEVSAFHLTLFTDASKGVSTLKKALAALTKKADKFTITHLSVHDISKSPAFQKELITALDKLVPKKLAAALKSAGNMHNPAMVALRGPFDQAVMETPTVQAYNRDLAPYGLKIDRAGHEKLTFVRKDDTLQIYCFLWLNVVPLEAR